jgi:hypothetical protein
LPGAAFHYVAATEVSAATPGRGECAFVAPLPCEWTGDVDAQVRFVVFCVRDNGGDGGDNEQSFDDMYGAVTVPVSLLALLGASDVRQTADLPFDNDAKSIVSVTVRRVNAAATVEPSSTSSTSAVRVNVAARGLPQHGGGGDISAVVGLYRQDESSGEYTHVAETDRLLLTNGADGAFAKPFDLRIQSSLDAKLRLYVFAAAGGDELALLGAAEVTEQQLFAQLNVDADVAVAVAPSVGTTGGADATLLLRTSSINVAVTE